MKFFTIPLTSFVLLGVAAATVSAPSQNAAQPPFQKMLEGLQETVEEKGSFTSTDNKGGVHVYTTEVKRIDRQGLDVKVQSVNKDLDGTQKSTMAFEFNADWSNIKAYVVKKDMDADNDYTFYLILKQPVASKVTLAFQGFSNTESTPDSRLWIDLKSRADCNDFRDKVVAILARLKIKIEEGAQEDANPPKEGG